MYQQNTKRISTQFLVRWDLDEGLSRFAGLSLNKMDTELPATAEQPHQTSKSKG